MLLEMAISGAKMKKEFIGSKNRNFVWLTPRTRHFINIFYIMEEAKKEAKQE